MNNIQLRKMKKSIKVILLFAISLAFFITACNKENTSKNDEGDMFKSVADIEADLNLNGGEIEKVITNPLVKIDDCDYIVSGTIEFQQDGEVLAVIDYGDGECDDIATVTKDGETFEISLKKKEKEDWFYKVVTEPIVKIEGCDYIVSGIVEFYSTKDDSWLATINFGDGECDEWATKITDDGTFVFSMDDWGNKEKP